LNNQLLTLRRLRREKITRRKLVLERETNKRFSPNLPEDFADNPNTKSGIEFSLRKSLVEGIFGIEILQNTVQNKNQPFSASVEDFQQKTAILATQMHRWLTFWWWRSLWVQLSGLGSTR
jgi:hypothetical protein